MIPKRVGISTSLRTKNRVFQSMLYRKSIIFFTLNLQLMKTTGFIFLTIGVVFTIFTTFKFFTKEKIVDLGLVEISKSNSHEISWSPLFGIAIVCVGGLFLWQASRKDRHTS